MVTVDAVWGREFASYNTVAAARLVCRRRAALPLLTPPERGAALPHLGSGFAPTVSHPVRAAGQQFYDGGAHHVDGRFEPGSLPFAGLSDPQTRDAPWR